MTFLRISNDLSIQATEFLRMLAETMHYHKFAAHSIIAWAKCKWATRTQAHTTTCTQTALGTLQSTNRWPPNVSDELHIHNPIVYCARFAVHFFPASTDGRLVWSALAFHTGEHERLFADFMVKSMSCYRIISFIWFDLGEPSRIGSGTLTDFYTMLNEAPPPPNIPRPLRFLTTDKWLELYSPRQRHAERRRAWALVNLSLCDLYEWCRRADLADCSNTHTHIFPAFTHSCFNMCHYDVYELGIECD